jgi:hypothetical protein
MSQVIKPEQNNALAAEILALKAQNAELVKRNAEAEARAKASERKLGMKVSDKGALSVYGMGRFPVTLYKGQWRRVLGITKEILAFIEADEAGDKKLSDGKKEA